MFRLLVGFDLDAALVLIVKFCILDLLVFIIMVLIDFYFGCVCLGCCICFGLG